MTTWLAILVDIILPIFLILGIGVVADRRFKLDLGTLSKLNFYVFVPALLFIALLEADLAPRFLAGTALFTGIHILLMYTLACLLFRPGQPGGQTPVLRLGCTFFNAGNYGIPFAVFAFGETGAGVMAIVMAVHNFAMFTLGIWTLQDHGRGWRKGLASLSRVPALWAIGAALIFRYSPLELPGFLLSPLRYLGDGLIPLALLTLGVQLGRNPRGVQWQPVAAVTALRLLVSPLIAGLVILLLPLDLSAIAPVLIAAAGLPVAVNVYVLSLEYDRAPDSASQIVFWSTVLSAVTVGLLCALLAYYR